MSNKSVKSSTKKPIVKKGTSQKKKKNNNTTSKGKQSTIGSRVTLHKELYDEDLNITKQQSFSFQELNESLELDTSFIDGKKTQVQVKQSNKEPSKKARGSYRCGFVIVMGLLLLVISIVIYHYATFQHNSTKETIIPEDTYVVDDNYLFLGDSITDFYDLDKYYPKLPVVNSGVSGDTTEDILNNMKERVYQYNPSKIFLLIGTNDFLEDRSVNDIVRNISNIVMGIQKNRPYTTLYIESILPINRSDDKKIDSDMVNKKRTNEKIREINKKLRKLAADKKIVYIDLYEPLTDDNQDLKLEYTKEGLHLSDQGYEKVTEILMGYIKENDKKTK